MGSLVLRNIYVRQLFVERQSHEEEDNPEIPDNPDNPNTPDNPDNPDIPDNPNIPDNPDTPDDPGTQTNICTLTFVPNGGEFDHVAYSNVTDQKLLPNGNMAWHVECGAQINPPREPDFVGHTFVKWEPEFPQTVPDHDTTYTAQWRVNQYTVTFNYNNGEGGSSYELDYGNSLTAPQVSSTGYEFNGWQPTVPNTVPLDGGTYTAQWTPIEYTISYDMDGHGEPNPSNLLKYTVETGEYAPQPPENVEGWAFMGWTPASIPAGNIGNVTFTANWKLAVTEDESLPPEGWTRLWWTTPRDSESEEYTDLNIVGDLTSDSIQVEGHDKTQIVSAEIGTNVTGISPGAFRDCTALETASIPESVTSIGGNEYYLQGGAFHGCGELTSINIPNSVTNIGACAFYRCGKLNNVEIPNRVTNIGSYAFAQCSSITSVTIPDSVTSIGTYAFYYCTGLTNATVGSGVTRLSWEMFSCCNNLKTISLSNGITEISNMAFYGCSMLTNITIPNSVTDIGQGAFQSSGLTSIVIPDSVTTIGNKLFEGCGNLAEATIGDGISDIKERMFCDCSNLANVTIGNGVRSIGTMAFHNCSRLTSMTIPNSVGEIISSAFGFCSGFAEVTIVENGGNTQDTKERLIGAGVPSDIIWNGDFPQEPVQVTVTFDANGGTGGWSRTMQQGEGISAPVVSKEGYTFNGWNPSVDATVPDHDVTYVAQWQENEDEDTYEQDIADTRALFETPAFQQKIAEINEQYPIPQNLISDEELQELEEQERLDPGYEEHPFDYSYQDIYDNLSSNSKLATIYIDDPLEPWDGKIYEPPLSKRGNLT